jgi:hypothetical protein
MKDCAGHGRGIFAMGAFHLKTNICPLLSALAQPVRWLAYFQKVQP